MAISFIGSTGGGATAGANVTLTLPGTYKAGDIAIVTVTLGTSKTTTLAVNSSASVAYTQIAGTITSSNARFGVFRQTITSTSTMTVATITGSAGSTDGTTGVIMIFRGIEFSTQNGLDATPTTATGTATNPNSPSITVASCSDAVITAVGQSVTTALTAPSSFLQATSASAAATDPALTAMAYVINVSTAAIDPAAWTGATPQWCAATIALKPSIDFGSVFAGAQVTTAADDAERARTVAIESY